MKERVKHEGKEGEPVKTGEGGGPPFVIFGQAAKTSGPGKGAFAHPSLRQENKAAFGFCGF